MKGYITAFCMRAFICLKSWEEAREREREKERGNGKVMMEVEIAVAPPSDWSHTLM